MSDVRDVVAARARARARDAAIARLAAAQRGQVSRQQLLAVGLSSSAIARGIAAGRLHRSHQGVYLVGHPVAPVGAAEAGALLACGPNAVLSHRTAAWIWGFVPRFDGPVEVTLVSGDRRPKDVRVHRTRRIDARDTTRRHGLRVTTPARTLLDCAETLDAPDLERAVEEALAGKRVTERQLRGVIKRTPGRRGGARLTALLDHRGDGGYTRSRAEDALRRLARAAGLPQPKANARILGYEVDFLWPKQRVIVEVDSWTHHADRRSFEHDRRKSTALQAAGHPVLPITWRQLTAEPHAVTAKLAAALALASQR